MKHTLILLTVLLLLTNSGHAGWFSKKPDPTLEFKEKITVLENQLSVQSRTLNHWQIAVGCLGIGCVLFLVIGTALGANTRKHYDGTGRMGSTPANTATPGLNGKPRIMAKAHQRNGSTPLEA